MKNRVIKVLLTMAMVVGLMPGMSLTAYADNTETLLTTITATGIEQASYSSPNVATVSFSNLPNTATETYGSSYHAAWGWWGYGWTATVTPADGYTITKCVFYDDANYTATDSSSPFVVKTTADDQFPLVNGSIISKTRDSKGIKKIDVYGYATPVATHSVTVKPGSNMTKTTDSGAESQTVTAGQAMNTVTYTASTNYCFDNFTDIESNGVKAERTNSTTVTVSGTPTGDVEITVPDALKKVKVITDDTYGQDKGGIVAGIFTEDDDKYVLCSKNSDGKYVINVVPSTGYSFGNASTYVILGVEYDTANNQILFSDETVNSVGITFYKPLKIDFGSGHTELLKKLVKEMGGDARIDGTCMTFDPRYYEENNAYLYQANMTYSFISMIKSELEGKCVDNGECFFYIGRKAEYNSDDEIAEEKADKTTKVKDIVSAGGSFYMCWYDYSCSGDIVWTKGNTGSKEFEFKRNICDKGFAFGGEDVDVPPGLILASTYDLRGTVKIDDTYVTDKVTFSEGSLVVSVPDTVLNGLGVGTHTIKVLFEDNLEASKAFTIEDAAEGGGDSSEIIYRLPKTGIE